ncbi:MAG TPA: hypothetical protein VLA91_14925 [Acidimicrobiia bacterium]|nr:hypothetical protein [Acidimicrobiia bacterium]
MKGTAVEPSSRRFSLSQLILIIPWVPLVVDAWAPIRDNSFLWHIRAGELQARSGEVLVADPFSFTMQGEPWLTQSWLTELLYSWGESHWGLGFVPPMLLVISSITFLAIGLAAFRRSKSLPATAIVLILTTVLLLSFLVPRPVIFSFAIFAVVILAWDRPSARWCIPFLFWIWASVHGSFVIGLAYVGLTIIAQANWKGLPTAIVAGLTTLVTAHGLGVLEILLEFSEAGPALALLTEWRQPEVLSVVFFPFLVGVALIVFGAARGLVAPRHLWILVPFLLLAFSSTRAVPPAWIALVPLLATALAGLGVGESRRFSVPAAALFATVVLVLPFLIASDGSLDEERLPVAAATHLADVPTFHDDRAGGYLIWAMGPERLVYIDDRAELYGDNMAEFVAMRDLETDWEPVFQRDHIEQALLRTDEDLVGELEAAGWRATYEDESYVVLRP